MSLNSLTQAVNVSLALGEIKETVMIAPSIGVVQVRSRISKDARALSLGFQRSK